MSKLKLKKGDIVKVTTGNAKNSQGKILEINTEKLTAIVEGVNMVSKHTKPNAKHPQGGIVKQEAPVHVSNLKLVDPKTGEVTRVGRKEVDGKIVRYAKKSGEVIK
ncbi:MAG: 50S ribosomal protein L24 [Bacteroidia bacterium]|nr:50S ribosomal protein L24 [Bacteroidia bacterium]